MNAPLVSVIIPTYNRAETVCRSVDSALAQLYRPIEVIVVDDGSTDLTREALHGYGDQIRRVFQINGGPSVARNNGAAQARGEFVAFLDSDDTWAPQKLSRQMRLILAGGDQVPCCICNAFLINGGEGSRTSFEVSDVMCDFAEGYWLNPALILATRFILFNQVVVVRRRDFDRIGRFKPGMRLLEDHDLALRLARLGPWAFVSEPLVEKYNDTDGIGVVAMLDPLVHARAWQGVLEAFLNEPISCDWRVNRFVRRGLADVNSEIKALIMRKSSWLFIRGVSKSCMYLMQMRRGFWRRLPGWPRVDSVRELPKEFRLQSVQSDCSLRLTKVMSQEEDRV